MATGNKYQAAPTTPLKPSFEVIDDAFSLDNSGGYHFSILIETDCISCSVLDTGSNRYLALQEFRFEADARFGKCIETLKDLGTQGELFSGEYGSVSAALVHAHSTLIPAPLYEESSKHKYLNFSLGEGQDRGDPGAELINEAEAQNLYAIPMGLDQALKKLFPQVRLHHFSTPMIEHQLVQNKNQAELNIYANIRTSEFDMIVINNGDLQLYNSFRYKSKEDVVYYLLYVSEQLKLNPDQFALTLFGKVKKDSELCLLIETYIRNVNFGSRPAGFEYSIRFGEVPGHHHLNLFNQYNI